AGSFRRARNYRSWQADRRARRAAAAAAEHQLGKALRGAERLRVRVASSRAATAAGNAKVAQLTAEMEPLAETVSAARHRWADHVPAGPSQAETEDPPLLEWGAT